MAQFAPVVPLQIARLLQGDDAASDIFEGYHLLLAHDVLAHPDEYKEVYSTVRKRWADSFIILDNSIVELGAPMVMAELVEACKIVQPDCLVIPDEMGDGRATRERAENFVQAYVKHCYNTNYHEAPPLMGVIQGRTVEEALHTATLYCGLPLVEFVSIPRIMVKQQGSRMPLLQDLLRAPFSRMEMFQGIHLLGFSDNLLDDVACARMPIVKGIDSAVPVRAGLQDQHLSLDYPEDYGPRGDFWDTNIDAASAACYKRIDDNIRQFREWIKQVVDR